MAREQRCQCFIEEKVIMIGARIQKGVEVLKEVKGFASGRERGAQGKMKRYMAVRLDRVRG